MRSLSSNRINSGQIIPSSDPRKLVVLRPNSTALTNLYRNDAILASNNPRQPLQPLATLLTSYDTILLYYINIILIFRKGRSTW